MTPSAQITSAAAVLVIGLVALITLSILYDIFRTGRRRVQEAREEGGGVMAKATGELHGGQRRTSRVRGNGLHLTAMPNGKVSARLKSVLVR